MQHLFCQSKSTNQVHSGKNKEINDAHKSSYINQSASDVTYPIINKVRQVLSKAWLRYPPAWIVCYYNPLDITIVNATYRQVYRLSYSLPRCRLRFYTARHVSTLYFHDDAIELAHDDRLKTDKDYKVCYADPEFCSVLIGWFRTICWNQLISYKGILLSIMFSFILSAILILCIMYSNMIFNALFK